PAAAASSSASSRSVASLATGCRRTVAPSDSARSRAPGATESMSPTTRSTCHPRCWASSRPESTATASSASNVDRTSSAGWRPSTGPPENTTAVTMSSLRWNYPDQVHGSAAPSRPLSPLVRAPRIGCAGPPYRGPEVRSVGGDAVHPGEGAEHHLVGPSPDRPQPRVAVEASGPVLLHVAHPAVVLDRGVGHAAGQARGAELGDGR